MHSSISAYLYVGSAAKVKVQGPVQQVGTHLPGKVDRMSPIEVEKRDVYIVSFSRSFRKRT
jgi:hypothetical protein